MTVCIEMPGLIGFHQCMNLQGAKRSVQMMMILTKRSLIKLMDLI